MVADSRGVPIVSNLDASRGDSIDKKTGTRRCAAKVSRITAGLTQVKRHCKQRVVSRQSCVRRSSVAVCVQ